MIVLGIDPGSRRTGWGIVEQEGSRLQLLAMGVLAPPAAAALPLRLVELHRGLSEVLAEHALDAAGMETVFHGPNTRSLVTLGQARGALLTALGASGLPLSEISPSEIKKAVTGRGGASKDQVASMVRSMLGSSVAAREAELSAAARRDATDALAVAVATLHRQRWERALAR
ncbi:MAG: crossover junction endodeoxyribonuclease RuvC [Planctomycetota bacterium]|nr:MAG: crossover junction endodeoxyribonuclease RuvC [Planctomycetota bacterium]